MSGFEEMSKALGIDEDKEESKIGEVNETQDNHEGTEEEQLNTPEGDVDNTKQQATTNLEKTLGLDYARPPIPRRDVGKFEDKYNFGNTQHAEEVGFPEVAKNQITGGRKMGDTNVNLVYEGDEFLTDLLDKHLYTTNEDTLSIPIDHKELYKSKVDVENVEQIIENAFASNQKRVSFALEELGLHNRLIEMGQVSRQFSDFTLIKTDKGNVVVHHTQNSLSDIEKEFMEEARACIKEGKRIIIPLLEDYEFEDGLGLTLKRKKFRASFSEIKNFISRAQMQGTITKNAMLVLYE